MLSVKPTHPSSGPPPNYTVIQKSVLRRPVPTNPVRKSKRENGTTVTFNNYAIGFFRRSKDADELLIQHIATSLGTLPRGSCGCPSRHAPRKVASDTPSRRAAFCRLRYGSGCALVRWAPRYGMISAPARPRGATSRALASAHPTGRDSRAGHRIKTGHAKGVTGTGIRRFA